MRGFGKTLRELGAGALLVALAACGLLEPRADKTRLYVLATSDELGAPAPSSAVATHESVGLGPIELPSYVLRPELVERRGATGIEPLHDERWAEPLDRGVTRVLVRDLELALGVKSIALHPWYADSAPRWQVKLAFSRFEREETGRVIVAASWQIVDTATHIVRVEHESRFARELTAHEAATTAHELSQALSDLGAEIAGSLSQHAAP